MNEEIINKIRIIIERYKSNLYCQINERKEEMEKDNNEHYLIYSLLGIEASEDKKIDLYQNVGRFVFKYAGSMLEEIVILCFLYADSNVEIKKKLQNTVSSNPNTVEIDLLSNNLAHEIKWRDATTDGDHINKEKNRIMVIKQHNYIPVRIMFFEPNRKQAINVQKKLKRLYEEVGGQYYSGRSAWEYIKLKTGVDLKGILLNILKENTIKDGTK